MMFSTQRVRFSDKTTGRGLPVHTHLPTNTKIPPPCANLSNSCMMPQSCPVSFPVCSLSRGFNGSALWSGRNNSYWERPEPNTTEKPFPIEPLTTTVADQTWRQKPTGLQRGEGSNVWHWDTGLAEMCVATEHFSIQRCVGEGGLSFHEGELRHYKRWPSCMTCLSVKPLAESDVCW